VIGAISEGIVAGTGWANFQKLTWAVDVDSGALLFSTERADDRIGFASLLNGQVLFAEVGSGSSGSKAEHLVALDARDGREAWSIELSHSAPISTGHVGYKRLTTAGGRVFLSSTGGTDGVGRVWCVSDEGQVIWQSSRVLRYPETPAVGNGEVVVTASGSLVSIELESGTERWRVGGGDYSAETFHWAVPMSGRVVSAKSEFDGQQVTTSVVSHDPETGDEQWRWGGDVPFAFGPGGDLGASGLLVFQTTIAVAGLDVTSPSEPDAMAQESLIDPAASVAQPSADSPEAFDDKVQAAVQAEIDRVKASIKSYET
jgi:outer membrane protein assembly factor BamB